MESDLPPIFSKKALSWEIFPYRLDSVRGKNSHNGAAAGARASDSGEKTMKANLNSAPRLGAQRRVAAAPMPSAARSVTAALTLAATLTLALAGLAEARHRGGPPPR